MFPETYEQLLNFDKKWYPIWYKQSTVFPMSRTLVNTELFEWLIRSCIKCEIKEPNIYYKIIYYNKNRKEEDFHFWYYESLSTGHRTLIYAGQVMIKSPILPINTCFINDNMYVYNGKTIKKTIPNSRVYIL